MLFDEIKKHLPTPTKEGSCFFTGAKENRVAINEEMWDTHKGNTNTRKEYPDGDNNT